MMNSSGCLDFRETRGRRISQMESRRPTILIDRRHFSLENRFRQHPQGGVNLIVL
jgi:hypothetical protein